MNLQLEEHTTRSGAVRFYLNVATSALRCSEDGFGRIENGDQVGEKRLALYVKSWPASNADQAKVLRYSVPLVDGNPIPTKERFLTVKLVDLDGTVLETQRLEGGGTILTSSDDGEDARPWPPEGVFSTRSH